MIVVDPDVTRQKLGRELELWRENQPIYRRRGWVLLGHEGFAVDIGFLGRLPLGALAMPALTACVRIDFTNFDLWPPSVEFIDPLTGAFTAPPVQALVDTDEGPRDLVVHGHPETNRPFFCVPGIREYHEHPQHSGDSWLLHRATREGSLATICDRIWRTMARNLLGLHVELQTLPGQLKIQLRAVNAPGDVAARLWDEVKQATQAAPRGESAPDSTPQAPQVPAMLGDAPAPANEAHPGDEL